MTDTKRKVWLITGASRGMGVEFVKTALKAGDKVVATARDVESLKEKFDSNTNLLFTKLDVTKPEDAENSIKKVITTFGGIDILINNAGVSYKGYFEEMSMTDIKHQLEVNLIGSMNVTRAVLPVFRKQRKGLIITISSGAGIQGFEFSSAYAASKFAIEGWMDALQKEVEHFGINTMLVNPGFFRTELISDKSMSFADGSITDYDKLRDKQKKWWESMAGKQPGDPKKLSEAIYQLTQEPNIPTRFVAGRDVIEIIDRKIEDFTSQVNSYRDLSSSLDFG